MSKLPPSPREPWNTPAEKGERRESTASVKLTDPVDGNAVDEVVERALAQVTREDLYVETLAKEACRQTTELILDPADARKESRGDHTDARSSREGGDGAHDAR